MARTILALDLGATTGWFLLRAPEGDGLCSGHGGVWTFPGNRHERLYKFYKTLLTTLDADPPDVVAYERPFARGLPATRSLWGMAGVVEAIAGEYGAVLDVNPQTLKRWIADRLENIKADQTKAGSLELAPTLGEIPVDDNHADAVCLAHYVLKTMRTD